MYQLGLTLETPRTGRIGWIQQNGPPLAIVLPSWVPDNGALVITLPKNQPLGSIYLPKMDFSLSCSAVPVPEFGNPFYVASPPEGESNPQTIPLPIGTTQVTLSGSSSSTYYVWAFSGMARLLIGGPAAT
jgi:hypothetical protein